MRRTLSLLAAFALAPALTAAPAHAQAAADPSAMHERRGWVDAGIGWGRMEFGGARRFDGSALLLDFSAGRWLSHRVALGARAGGWTLEGFSISDPRQGESLSEVLALLRVRPFPRRPLTLSLAGGWASYTANDPAAILLEGDGFGWRAEVEWEAWKSTAWSVRASLATSWGSIERDAAAAASAEYRGAALLVRVAWRW